MSIECVERRIRSILAGSPVPEDPVHAENTLGWLLQKAPHADEALRIAALGHDIERASVKKKVRRSDFPCFQRFKDAHAENSAKILREIMEACGISRSITEEVCRLVQRHESGGDPRADLLRESDSLSFFEVNLPLYFLRESRETVLNRCVWGYRRLSAEGRRIVGRFRYEPPELRSIVTEAVELAS